MKNKYYLIVSIIIYLISLAIPLYINLHPTENRLVEYENIFGLQALILGWMTFPSLDFFCWLSNFTLFFCWIFYRKEFSFYVGIIGVIFASLFLINHFTRLDFMEVRDYNLFPLASFFWIASMILQVVASKLYNKKSQIG